VLCVSGSILGIRGLCSASALTGTGQPVLSSQDKLSYVSEIENNKAQTQQQQTSEAAAPPAAAHLFIETEIQNAVIALTALELAEPVAREYAQADARKAITVATWLAREKNNAQRKKIENPGGFLRSILDAPLRYGFRRLDSGDWIPPSPREPEGPKPRKPRAALPAKAERIVAGVAAAVDAHSLLMNERAVALREATEAEREEATRRAIMRFPNNPTMRQAAIESTLLSLVSERRLAGSVKA